MSDENNNEQSGSHGCLLIAILVMAPALMLLVSLCMSKVKLSFAPPAGQSLTEAVTTGPEETEPTVQVMQTGSYLVVIDAGHQKTGNRDTEPIGPGSSTQKAKVTSGTQGVQTGQEEYELNLQVALKLQRILEERGYRVEMTRTTHEVDISNAQRAQMANELEADVFIRIHANGDGDSEKKGIMTLCQTPDDPYDTGLYQKSRALSQYVLDETVRATGAEKQFVLETDTMSGINWCRVPVTIVEMGYLSNLEEDRLMATEEYQQKLAQGMANGIDLFFEGRL